ncbi:tripartite-type tricarboxylate transporter receptor subunit TctC [Planomicrobium soli]|uniref:Tripartite-type tricarboxylate transporter receptor subunit TctC n=1 Tax=Planomicrobium soli TaxID=1176648 RepID=A0A2P8GQK7_9BACL|nr:tripartite tricarboxylate transporter substrate binding protein [Planomicrobium soli]PSL36253.1 tripartite-type tricarboxylate transporter receptor subunit TctC [Planomicrobium soli]
MKKLLTYIGLSSLLILGGCSSGGSGAEAEQFPTKPIELVAPATPGGGWDATARAIQKILKDEELVEGNINVVNKPGGSGEVGWQYLKGKDAHSLAINSSLLITNNLLGQSELSYEDFTPLAVLTTEWISIAVANDSPFADAKQLMEQLKEDPSSIKIALAPGLGNNDHLSFVQAAKEYGVDVSKLNILIYESGGDVVTALLGGHVDVATMSISESKEQHLAGKFKVISVSSAERLEGLEEVPTWQEQGVDMVFPHWRGILGPPDMTEEEIAYYDKAIGDMVETEAWTELMKNNEWELFYKNSAESAEFLKEQTQMYDTLLSESGLTD